MSTSDYLDEHSPLSLGLRPNEYDDDEDVDPIPEGDPDYMLGSQKYVLDESIKSSKALGKKTITYPGSFVIIVNNISGPGMLSLPLVYQQAGWVVATIVLLFTWFVSTLSASAIIEAMSIIPGNSRFSERVEFATVVRHFFGNVMYWITQVLNNLSLETLNIASIIVTAQAMDGLLVFIFGATYALRFYPTPGLIDWSTPATTPFESDGDIIFSLGYLICAVFCLPMGFLNLDENVYFQYISFGVLVVLLVEFIIQFFVLGLAACSLPAFGDNMETVIGTIIFAFTFVVTIPSWINEKKENVNINKTLWLSTSTSTIFFILFGVLGALTYPSMVNGNILEYIPYCYCPWGVTTFFGFIFSIGVIGLGIPMFSIIIRYNLFVGEVCGHKWSAFWGAVFPWAVSWLLYQGDGFTIFVNWSSLFINGFINYSIPLILFCYAKGFVWLVIIYDENHDCISNCLFVYNVRVSRQLKKAKMRTLQSINDNDSLTTNDYMSKEKEQLLMSLYKKKDELTGWVRHHTYPGFMNNYFKFVVIFTFIIFLIITGMVIFNIGLDVFLLFFGDSQTVSNSTTCMSPAYSDTCTCVIS